MKWDFPRSIGYSEGDPNERLTFLTLEADARGYGAQYGRFIADTTEAERDQICREWKARKAEGLRKQRERKSAMKKMTRTDSKGRKVWDWPEV